MGWLGNLLGPRRGTGRPQKAFRRRSFGTLARIGLQSGVSHVKTGAASTWRRGRTKLRAAERRRYGHPLSGRERLQAGYHRVKNAYEDYQRPRTHGQIGHYRNYSSGVTHYQYKKVAPVRRRRLAYHKAQRYARRGRLLGPF